jgi:hypothetical protein
LPRLASLPPIDFALHDAGAIYDDVLPADWAGRTTEDRWPTDLRRWSDLLAEITRFELAGEFVGATIIARIGLERWSANLAFSNGDVKQQGESDAEFLDRIWARYRIEGVGRAFNLVSETLHSRGDMYSLIRWSTQSLLEGTRPAGTDEPVQLAMEASLIQLRGATADVALHFGRRDQWERLQRWPTQVPFPHHVRVIAPAIWPLHFETIEEWGLGNMKAESEQYWTRIAHLPRTIDDEDLAELALLAFVDRRYRAWKRAKESLAAERAQLGAEFNPSSLMGRMLTYVVTAEMATLLALWDVVPGAAQAMDTAAAALRAAFWIWLEDRNESVVATRVVLEGTAQARTWRLKPAEAARLRDRGQRGRLRDWTQASGWRRLGPLLQGIGDFSHFPAAADPEQGWTILTEVQEPDETRGSPIQTARGNTLDRVALLLAEEAYAQLVSVDADVGNAFRQVARLDDPHASQADLNRWLDRIWGQRIQSV